MSRLAEFNSHLDRECPRPDEITATLFDSWDSLFNMTNHEVDNLRLAHAQQRFATLRPQLRALDSQASRHAIDAIKNLDDLIPLLFSHSEYKSYPMALLEKRRFGLLTAWLDDYTTVDLSGVETDSCEGIDEWLEQLEQQARLFVHHTTGTTGKISFLPRTELEQVLWIYGNLKNFEGFADDPGIEVGFDGLRLACMYPGPRNGRYIANRALDCYAKYLTPTPDDIYTLNQGTLSADLVSLSGRIRVAQAKGELKNMQLDKAQKIALKRYLDELELRPQEFHAFMENMATTLKGRKVYVGTQVGAMTRAAQEGLKRGLREVFHPDSIGIIGGGSKGMELPDNWRELVEEFTGITRWKDLYGMSEVIGSCCLCDQGVYHIPPYLIPFLLDPESGAQLPRQGVQTGRFALFDCSAQSYWGGIMTGDKVTIDWRGDCGCGRNGAFIVPPVSRYSEAVTGDDKVTCSATVDNTDAALQELLNV